MRPVERGDILFDKDGKPKIYAQYRDARRDLIDRLGEFCSYCEMHLDACLALEHVQPKSRRADWEKDWQNFLLSCPNCNSTKGSKKIAVDDYLWPDQDNTFLAFSYYEGGIIKANHNLEQVYFEKARATLQLVGLDKTYLDNDPAMSDRRLFNRQKEWNKAMDLLHQYESAPVLAQQSLRKALCTLVDKYWSIWMTVFQNHHDVLLDLIQSKEFPGTCQTCFNDHGGAERRPGGLI